MADDLAHYRAKRRFARTPEPAGAPAPVRPEGELIFVVQKHRARRLHYDLRLELGGVLKSWAVPEGPCLDPKVRRFAKATEDHPMDYAGFEGVIPAGEYGAGQVIVWDRGTWTTPADPAAALAKGELKFRLAGEKLAGGWMLKRLPDDATNWLLIKERDPAARPLAEYDVARDAPLSVLSGLPVEALAPSPVAPAAPAPVKPARIKGAVKAPLPQGARPQLATLAPAPPQGPGWLHEIKFDGYRTLAFVRDHEVRLVTRNGLDWTARYRPLAAALAKLPCKAAVLDGEVCVQDARGVTTLGLLERALAEGRDEALTYFVFDLLHLDGFDLRAARLLDRKAALAGLLAPLIDARSPIQLSEHVEGDGAALFEHASRMGVEGVVSKRAESRAIEGRSDAWLKVKRVDLADFVVVGFTTNAPRAVAALILAEPVGADGALVYRGRVGSGIADAEARALHDRLAPRRCDKPATPVPRTPGAVWVEPVFEARVGHRGRSVDGLPRQPVLLAMMDRAAPAARSRKVKPVKPRLVTDADLAAIALTNPERAMLGDADVTKLDIALHYARVGDWLLPELLRRPLSLIRCPSGEAKDCFYQRHAFPGLPEGVETIELAGEEGPERFIAVTAPRGYLALAQFGVIELHPWGCRMDDPESPDRLILDLDPDPALPWAVVCDAAEWLRARLERLGLAPFLRLTGGKGVHLVMAVAAGHDWPTVKGFAEALARDAAAARPDLFVAVATKARRRNRIFVDYLRNGRGATAVASYSLRARPGFPVAAPIAWEELRGLPGADAFTIHTIAERLSGLAKDPWEKLSSRPTKISPAMRRDVGMVNGE